MFEIKQFCPSHFLVIEICTQKYRTKGKENIRSLYGFNCLVNRPGEAVYVHSKKKKKKLDV